MERISFRTLPAVAIALLASTGCGEDPGAGPGPVYSLEEVSGNGQSVVVLDTSAPLVVRVVDEDAAPAAGVTVGFVVVSGSGSVTQASVTSGVDGLASSEYRAGPTSGVRQVRAKVGGSVLLFDLTAIPGPPKSLVRNSTEPLVISAGATGPVLAATVRDSLGNAVPGVIVSFAAGSGTLSQMADTSNGAGAVGVSLTAPSDPGVVEVTASAAGGLSTTWTASVMVDLVAVTTVAQGGDYGIHDQFVRDGLVFASVWNLGLRIYDVGNGVVGGTPAVPVLVSTIVTGSMGLSCNCVHNAWWFHDPTLGQARYLFVGQEGPGSVGTSSSGSIHVVDVSDLAAPVEVATFTLGSVGGQPTGVHNFWMDEPEGILYAAYYNGGVVSIDVSDTLAGDLFPRMISNFKPSPDSYVWGVMAAGGKLYASDMTKGLWALGLAGDGTISAGAGRGSVNERYTSDLWVAGNVAYSGTWGSRGGVLGNVTKVWELDGAGLPVLRDSLKIPAITTVSDNEVSPGGELLLATAEGGSGGGLYIYERSDPLHPKLIARALVASGLHTGTFAEIGGKLYVFAAKNRSSSALVVFDVSSLIP